MIKVKFDFASGQKCKDLITGIEGIIESCTYNLEGGKQYSVQPISSDGITRPDGWLLDGEQLIEQPGGLENEKVFEIDFEFSPGDVIKDTMHGTKGTVTRCIYYLNKCIRYSVQPKLESSKIPESILCYGSNLKLIEGKGTKEKHTNGPSSKIVREKL